jgi:hypothetical protein
MLYSNEKKLWIIMNQKVVHFADAFIISYIISFFNNKKAYIY